MSFLAGCKSRQKVAKSGDFSSYTADALLKELNGNVLEFDNVTFSKVRFSLKYNGSTNNLNGLLHIVNDEEIYGSVTAFLGIEVARVLFTKEKVTVKSNLEKKLYVMDYNQLAKKYGISVDFNLIQEVLLANYPFKQVQNYRLSGMDNVVSIIPTKNISDVYVSKYSVESLNGTAVVISSELCTDLVSDCIQIKYDNFKALESKQKPYFIEVFNNNGDFNLTMNIQDIQVNTNASYELGNTRGFKLIQLYDIPF